MKTSTAPRPSLQGGRRADVHGWIHLHIEGKARARGHQHGYLLASEIREAIATIGYLIRQDTGLEFAWFAQNAEALFLDPLASNYGGKLTDGSGVEVLEELEGIVAGASLNRRRGDVRLTLADLLGWNAYPELICQWWPAVQSGQLKPAAPLPESKSRALAERAAHAPQRGGFHPDHSCSAFVAVGKQTLDGEVVIAHTTWQRFASGDAYNVILDLQPECGARILMQSVPGYVASSTDFLINDAGLAVTETSSSGSGFDPGTSAVRLVEISYEGPPHATVVEICGFTRLNRREPSDCCQPAQALESSRRRCSPRESRYATARKPASHR